MTSFIAKKFPEVLVIAGNVATGDGAKFLHDNGADVIKVGVGPGSLCSTRIEAAAGVPQISALIDSASDENREYKIISDGGIRRAGDCVKACCYADAVMLGSVLAGTDETPGEIYTAESGMRYKIYAGSSTHKASRIEGVAAHIPVKGSVRPIFQTLIEGMQSGLSYQGAKSIAELHRCFDMIRITNSGLVESHPHTHRVFK
jgi:IMP dehydrogenase